MTFFVMLHTLIMLFSSSIFAAQEIELDFALGTEIYSSKFEAYIKESLVNGANECLREAFKQAGLKEVQVKIGEVSKLPANEEEGLQDTWSFESQHQIDGINRVYQPGLLATKFRVIISEKVGTSHVPFVMTPELEAYNGSDVFQEIERINNKLIELSKSKKKQEALALYNEAMSKYGKYIINADNADEIYLNGSSFLKGMYDQGKAWDLDNQLVLAHEFMHAFAGLSDDYSEDAKPSLMSNLKCSFTEEQREKIVYRLYGRSEG